MELFSKKKYYCKECRKLMEKDDLCIRGKIIVYCRNPRCKFQGLIRIKNI